MDGSQILDTDVAAIRALVVENGGKAVETCENRAHQYVDEAAKDGGAPCHQSKLGFRQAPGGRLASWRPNVRVVLWSCAALLLLLKPALLLGMLLFFAVIFLGALVIAGPDAFWLRAIMIFRAYKRWFPASARYIRVLGLQSVRRWHKFLSHLPSKWSDSLSFPDLRAIAKADQRHAIVLEDRLRRLREERAF